jgi:hypothetical protein
MPDDLDAVDPHFARDLENSQDAVWHVARWLSGRGHHVTVRATHLRPDPSRLREYSDQGDLEIIQRVEVKHRPDLQFTSKSDFPYPSVIVDVAHAWDNAKPKPYAYVILNAPMTVGIVVLGSSAGKWTREETWDRKRNRKRVFYHCPLDSVTFLNLLEKKSV